MNMQSILELITKSKRNIYPVYGYKGSHQIRQIRLPKTTLLVERTKIRETMPDSYFRLPDRVIFPLHE